MIKIHGNKEIIKVTYLLYVGLLMILISEIGAYMNGDIDWIKENRPEHLLYYISAPLISTWIRIGFGREIELNETGCTIRCLLIRRRYRWDQMQYRQWIDYPKFMTKRTAYAGGIILSTKPIRTLFGKTDSDKYSFIHPLSCVNIRIYCQLRSRQTRILCVYPSNKSVNQESSAVAVKNSRPNFQKALDKTSTCVYNLILSARV